MLKNRALQRKRIAFYLAVMLMFCAFGTDGVAAFDAVHQAAGCTQKAMLEYPGAGEFFTDSLPLGDRQSVRELSGDWQSIIVIRPGRSAVIKSGPKGTQVFVAAPDGLLRTTAYSEYFGADIEIPIPRCSEIIVCYMHNQDGAKD